MYVINIQLFCQSYNWLKDKKKHPTESFLTKHQSAELLPYQYKNGLVNRDLSDNKEVNNGSLKVV